MRYIRLVLVAAGLGLVWLLGCGGPDWSLIDLSRPLVPRPSHYGFSLPYPVSAPPIDMNERTYGAIIPKTAERVVPVILDIDSTGRVTGITARLAEDSGYVERYSLFLEQYRFAPGLVAGTASPMPLLVDLQIGSETAAPIIHFPVDPNRAIGNSNRYWRAFGLLGVEVPTLTRFRSYNYEFGKANHWRHYPFKLFRIDLDSLGEVRAAELVLETGPEFTNQIKSAMHWGEYTPLRIDGRAVESSSFVVVSFYPMVDYPAAAVDLGAAEIAPWDRVRVRLLPDTVGIVLPPVPKREWSGEILDSFHQGMTPELVSGRLAIDSVGKSHLLSAGTEFHRARHVLNARAHNIQFFPAMKLDGSRHSFEGLIYLRYIDEANVRIWFEWLGEVDPGLPDQSIKTQ